MSTNDVLRDSESLLQQKPLLLKPIMQLGPLAARQQEHPHWSLWQSQMVHAGLPGQRWLLSARTFQVSPCVPFEMEILIGLRNEANTLLQCKQASFCMDTNSWHGIS